MLVHMGSSPEGALCSLMLRSGQYTSLLTPKLRLHLPLQALEGAQAAYVKLQALGVPVLRPSDYYAEMVKTDEHMLRVKDKLLHEQRQLEAMDERRKQRESKRYAKEVQAKKLKERAQTKKQDIESVKKWRKLRQNSNFSEGGDDFPVGLEDDNDKNAGPNKKRPRAAETGDRSSARGGKPFTPSKRRKERDTKYGFGGKKSLRKQNDVLSAGDMDSFRASFKDRDSAGARGRGRGRGSGQGRGGRGGSSRGRGGPKRLGKARREKSKLGKD
eukprot:SM000048S16507  [mRNA]  locus=s48:69464:70784:- [translate_table: standard]